MMTEIQLIKTEVQIVLVVDMLTIIISHLPVLAVNIGQELAMLV